MPALVAAALAGLGGAGLEFGGNLMASNAGVSRRTVRRRGLQALGTARSRDAVFGGLERAELLSGQKGERQGFAGARSALDFGRAAAATGIQQRGAEGLADLEQSAITSGKLGTSTAAQAFQGVQSQTSQQLANLDLQFAQALADLGLEEGALLGQQGRERTAMAAKQRDMERSLGEAAYQLYTLG